MAVPSSDTRDYAFAKHFGTKIIQVQQGPGTDISLPDFDPKAGAMINSDFLNGLEVKPAILAAIKYAEEKGFGKARINFRMRDAIFSRQRYWGEPIPVCYKNELPYLLPASELPLLLPEVDKYLPTETGEPPLGRAKNWHTTEGHPLETNTMPGWAGSSWYFLRYMDPENADAPFSKQAAEYWNQVDLYIGGAEHATGHLLYARFWTMFLHDLGYISFPEPFKKLVNQGMIQGVSEIAVLKIQKMVNSRDEEERKYQFISADCDPTEFETASEHALMEVHADICMVSADGLDLKAFCNWRKEYADAAFVTPGGFWKGGVFHPYNGAQNPSRFFRTRQEQEKMSKNKFNVVNPDDVIADYNADTLRMYEMFLGPLEQSKPWSTHGIEGTYKFLRKFWRLFFNEHDVFSVSDAEPKPEELRVLHKTIKKVEEDIERLSLNTAVSAFMVCANELSAMRCNKRAVLEPLLVVLSPYAPHLAEELWERLGHTESIAYASWPQWQEGYVIDDTFECPVSINGKVRVKLTFALNKPIQEIEDEAMAHEAVVKWLEGKLPKKVIVIPNRIVNVVL